MKVLFGQSCKFSLSPTIAQWYALLWRRLALCVIPQAEPVAVQLITNVEQAGWSSKVEAVTLGSRTNLVLARADRRERFHERH